MLQIYSTILSLYKEPKDMYKVCSLFMNILSNKGFWKKRHEREGLPYLESSLSHLRAYYLTREFVTKKAILSCHLSKLPFFPSFSQRQKRVPDSIVLNRSILYYYKGYSGRGIRYDRSSCKANINLVFAANYTGPGPNLEVRVNLERMRFGNYNFCLYTYLEDEQGRKVGVVLENTLIDTEQALSFYLDMHK
ncbi:Hypothetical protein BRZCDTV_270 [Brazilian cedratvirus IHUMI]|uniref:Uncharacterized protein n=1 Tax=Brazilian cedratvirus IHUMI TaxID=2126980 RepID=A0A2R8FE83_9VIRU|nr:Hypothetical protein BRZCDTV_270 [Brazilian cedratvirus IHUMI]